MLFFIVEYIEVYWSKSIPNSLVHAAYNISKALNISIDVNSIKQNLLHLKQHSNIDSNTLKRNINKYVEEDDIYKKVMMKL